MNIIISLFLSSIYQSKRGDPCKEIRVRKEVRQLSKQEWNRFAKALRKFHELEKKYELFAMRHVRYEKFSHGHPAFLWWHREYLNRLERELMKIDPQVTVPYWEWPKDYKNPAKSNVLSDDYAGGDGNPKNEWILEDGAFANMKFTYPDAHELKRNYNNDGKIKPFASPYTIQRVVNFDKFSRFSYRAEYYHGYVHDGIGGQEGDFLPLYSPLDPLFWMHHSYMDKLLRTWQERHPDSEYEGEYYKKNVTIYDHLSPFQLKIKETFDTLSEPYCYKYSKSELDDLPSSLKVPKNSEDESRSLQLEEKNFKHSEKLVTPLGDVSKRFLKMNHISQDLANKFKEEDNALANKINNALVEKFNDDPEAFTERTWEIDFLPNARAFDFSGKNADLEDLLDPNNDLTN